MKRLVTVVAIAVFLIRLVLLGSSDTDTSVTDTSIPDNEVVSRDANSVSAIATITITMYSVADE